MAELSWSRQQMIAAALEKKPRSSNEHDEQVSFFDALALDYERLPALKWIQAIPNGGHRDKAVAGKLKAEGVKKGVSDIFVPIPAGGYHGLYIEMKAGKNTLTSEQKAFGEFVKSRGYSFYPAWSAIEALAALALYLDVKLRGLGQI